MATAVAAQVVLEMEGEHSLLKVWPATMARDRQVILAVAMVSTIGAGLADIPMQHRADDRAGVYEANQRGEDEVEACDQV